MHAFLGGSMKNSNAWRSKSGNFPRQRHSARTTVGHMRPEEDTRDRDPDFKLNNNSGARHNKAAK